MNDNNEVKSFTLIEVLVVIIIIGILASLILFSTQDAYDKKSKLDILNLVEGIKAKNLNSLVAEWKFDGPTLAGSSATNSDVKDSWGYNHGDVVGHAPTVKDGEDCVLGKCLEFDGSTDYVNCGNLGNPGYGTISLWVSKKDALSRYLLDGRGTGNWWFLSHYNGYDVNFNNLAMWNGLQLNKWTFITVTVSPTVTKLYIDGDFKDDGGGLSINFSSVRIATRYTNSSYFLGFLDDIRIYNSAISVSEIKQNYVAGLNSLLQNGAISKEEYNQRTLNLAKND